LQLDSIGNPIFLDRIDRIDRMFRTCLPAGRYKQNKKILLILLILSKKAPPQAAKFKIKSPIQQAFLKQCI